jgi:hypothetical protein
MGVAVTFDDDNVAVRVEPGSVGRCSIRLENTGMVVDGVLLDVLGEAAEWATVEPAEINLLPGASAPATIVFKPPRTAALPPGGVPFGLRAMSREDPDGSRIEEGTVEVGEFSDLSTSLVPKSATGRRRARFRLVVENRGNRPEHLTIDAIDPDVKLAFRASPMAFTAPPGAATYVRLTTVPRKRFFKGPNRMLPFQVSAQPEDGDAVTADGVMLEKQILPEWLLPVLGIALAAAAILIALWFTVLRPIVHSAATAAADAGRAAGSAKSAAGSAKSAAKSAKNSSASGSASPAALDVSLATPTILTRTTELATVTGSFSQPTSGAQPTVVWTSSNPKIARVSQSGVVTGLSSGSATITATTVTKASHSPDPSPSASASRTPSAQDSAKSSVVSGSTTVNVVGKVHVSSTVLPEAAIGKPYSASLSASGGTGDFTWSVSGGALPAGLSLTPSTGAVTGTPTALGKSTFTVHVTDTGPPTQFATGVVVVHVVKPLAVDTSSLPGGTVGDSYSRSLAALGGTPPYRWSISPGTGTLPSGLRLDATTGAITGTPTASGNSTFVVQVSDSASPSQSATESLSVDVANPLSMSTLTLPTAVVNSSYSQTLSAFGGSQPYTWSVTSGSLPAGLTLSPGSGTLTGTPTATGSSTFTVQVVDSDQPALSASRTFTVMVVTAFNATTSSLPTGKVGKAYSAQLTATGGVSPYVWSLQGTLPDGLQLSPSGAITGTPTATGIFPFTVQVVDSSSPPLSTTASLSITVVSPLSITTASLPEGVTGIGYSQTVQATGGTQPYTWSVSSGSLPTGLSLSASTGEISGEPVDTGTTSFTISVTDSDTPTAQSTSLSTSITVVEPLAFTEPTLPDGVQGDDYSPVTPNHVSGGSGNYTWSITSGVLPAGLSLDSSTGTISGTVSASAALGAQNFTLTVADAVDSSITSSQQETITVYAPLQITSAQLNATADASFSQNLNSYVTGGRAPYTFSALTIDNLSVDTSTGVISGTPDAPCAGGGTATADGEAIQVNCPVSTYNATVTVTDANGTSVTAPLVLNVMVTPMTFDPVTSLPNISDGDNYNQPTLAGDTSPAGGYGQEVDNVGGYSFSTTKVSVGGTSGAGANNNGLPCDEVGCSGLAGTGELSIDSSTGVISGDLHDLVETTIWTFDVHLTDTDPLNTNNQITTSFQLVIECG